MYLIDTNIFLEILLSQEKGEKCKKFLEETENDIYISDFSLHSIGVILFKNNQEDVFLEFLNDIFLNLEIITLSPRLYKNLLQRKKILNLDFDDAYQIEIAKEHNLKIVTLDMDFKKIEGEIGVIFL